MINDQCKHGATGPCDTSTAAAAGPVLSAKLSPLPPGREYIAGTNRHFAKVCGTVIAYSEDDLRAYAAAAVAAERERNVNICYDSDDCEEAARRIRQALAE